MKGGRKVTVALFIFVVNKKMPKMAAASLPSSASSSSPPISISSGSISKSSSSSAVSKKKADKAIQQFIADVLPALKKEMTKSKKEPFSWEPFLAYFKPENGFVATYCLPLFKFLEKSEIICSRYGCFEGKHTVKTDEGFQRVMLLSKHCDTSELTPDMQQYLLSRYGKDWFKIPSKDGFRAKAAASSGHEGKFKMILTNIFEDSFIESSTGKVIYTINPVLSFQPLLAPTPKKAKAPKKPSSSSSSPPPPAVGAQEVPLEHLPEASSEKEEEEGDEDQASGGE